MNKKMLNEFRRLSGLKLINENISKDKYEIFKSFKEHLKTIDDLTSDFEAGVEGRARAILGSSKEIKSLEDLLQQLYVDNPSLKDFLDKEYLNENHLNEDTYTDAANVVANKLVQDDSYKKKLYGGSDDLYQFIIDNRVEIIKMANELDEITNIYKGNKYMLFLANNPEQVKYLKNNL